VVIAGVLRLFHRLVRAWNGKNAVNAEWPVNYAAWAFAVARDWPSHVVGSLVFGQWMAEDGERPLR